MNFFQVQPDNIHLSGISRTGSFTLHNRNPFLALSFQILLNQDPPRLTVFPKQGVLLRGDDQKIRVKYAGGSDSTFDSFMETISARVTLKTEYNRQLMIKENFGGWDQLPSETQDFRVNVQVGGEKEAVEHFIKEDVIFNHEFAEEQLNLSAIHSSRNHSFISQASFNELQIQSKLHPGPEANQNVIGNVPVQDLCSLQYGQSKVSARQFSKLHPEPAHSQPNSQQASRLLKDISRPVDVDVSLKTVRGNDFSSDFSPVLKSSSASSSSSARSLELMILAVVAAFFVALGNNMGRLRG